MKRFSYSSEYYNSIAKVYDSMYEDEYWEIARRQIEMTIIKYKPQLSGTKILDVGAGTGYWSLWALQRGAYVTLVEPAENMLQIAKEKIQQAGLMERARFINSTAEQMDEYIDEQFDVIFALGDVLSYVSDLDKVLSVLSKISSPDALMFATVDNYYSYLKDVIIHGTLEDYKLLEKRRKLPIGSEHGIFEARCFTAEEIEMILKEKDFQILELVALVGFKDVEKTFKYSKFLINEAEHLFFVSQKQ
ncbi:MAG: class I SAM-dependent methyltransferase [Fervidobacterium sp.]|uniref:class I SAM-dependent methyltransferase n=1 Tax=Fervidobacterium sp. TaxID=1871331 RepID=UPI00404B70D8